MRYKSLLLIIALIALSKYVCAQSPDVIMGQQDSVVSCGYDLYDSGGDTVNYNNNEDFTLLCRSSLPSFSQITLYLAYCSLSDYDALMIYDGESVVAPLLATIDSNSNNSALVIRSSISNTTGALTVRFVSNNSGNSEGFRINVVCGEPCQNIVSAFGAGTFPMPTSGNTIGICNENEVLLVLDTTLMFPENDVIYHQDAASCSYFWDFGDGATATGLSVFHQYSEPGKYNINIGIADAEGCINLQQEIGEVLVSGMPVSHINTPAALCPSQGSTVISVGYGASNTVVLGQYGALSGSTAHRIDTTMYIPDGPNCTVSCYDSYLTINNMDPGSAIVSGDDLLEVGVIMEHSFVGDLEINVICPSGHSIALKQFISSGGGDLGISNPNNGGNPCDPSVNPPGTGYPYAWSVAFPQVGTMNDLSSMAILDSTNITNHTGYYTPDEDFSALAGCPYNGTWAIEICDHWAIDNGYIFGWWILFAKDTLFGSFSVPVTDIEISGPYSTPQGDTALIVSPTTEGVFEYNISLTDSFGCVYDTVIYLTVSAPAFDLGHDTTLQAGQILVLDAGPGWDSYLWFNGDSLQIIVLDTGILGTGTHQVFAEVTDSFGCAAIDTISITFEYATGQQSSSGQLRFDIFPNPANEIFQIALPDNIEKEIEVCIVDLSGRVLMCIRYNNIGQPALIEADASHLDAGIYIIVIKAEGAEGRRMLVKN